MIKKSTCFTLASLLLLVSCHYHDDNLVIRNNSNKTICYETLTKSVGDNEYYQISGGGKIKAHETDSPPVRGSIENSIENEPSDKNLYVIFYDCKQLEFINKDINNSVESGKFQVNKYSKEELEKANWYINYSEK